MSNIVSTTDDYTLLYFGDRKHAMLGGNNIKALPKADGVKYQIGLFDIKKFKFFFKEENVIINELHFMWSDAIFALIKPRPDTNLIEILILSLDKYVGPNFNHEYILSLIEERNHIYSDKLKGYAELYFKKNFNPHAHLFRSYNDCYKEEQQTFPDFKQKMQRVIKEGSMFMNGVIIVPTIKKVIINDPAVIIFWSDGSKTTGKCMENDTFNPEVGFAMAISKKYFEIVGCENPRAEFKNQLKNATDQSKKTAEKKALKEKLKAKAEKHD